MRFRDEKLGSGQVGAEAEGAHLPDERDLDRQPLGPQAADRRGRDLMPLVRVDAPVADHPHRVSRLEPAVAWMEPPVVEHGMMQIAESREPWFEARMALIEPRVRTRLAQLSAYLGDADWLDGAFSAGDLLMISVLQRLRSSKLVDGYPNLAAYVARGEARPAYQRAFAAQLAVFQASQG